MAKNNEDYGRCVGMKKIGIAEIEDGLILAKEVVNENDQLLLGAGVTIKKDQIEKLLENNILEVYVVDSEEDDPVLALELKQIEEECVGAVKKIIEERVDVLNDFADCLLWGGIKSLIQYEQQEIDNILKTDN